MLQAPIFETDPGYGGDPVYTPQEPGAPPATSIPVSPAPAPTPTQDIFAPAPVAVPVPVPRHAPTNLPVPTLVPAPRFAVTDYSAAARALMPRGLAWPTDPDTEQSRTLSAIAATFERSDGNANALLSGSLPGQATPLLPEWEATLGLPDPCAGENPTLEQRLNQVRGRFVGAGGQSRQRFIDFAAALGFKIKITNYAPFRAGLSTVGNPLASDAWSFVWGVTIVETTGALPVDALICELEAIKPAETTLILLS
jgi:uncharacterized protein YmfQ (DUF2313 family)